MTKRKTKTEQWNDAVLAARQAVEKAEALQEQVNDAKVEIVDALEVLKEMAEEYGSIYDNMNEGLQQSPYGLKCEAMQQLDLEASSEDELDELVSKIDEAENAELPLGFGRD
jgi:hypothetical protein